MEEVSQPYVIKRNGKKESVDFNQVLDRMRDMAHIEPKLNHVDYTRVAAHVVSSITSGISTRELDQKAMNDCAALVKDHPEYGYLAGRLAVSNLQKETDPSFVKTMEKIADWINPETGKKANLLSEEFLKWLRFYGQKLDDLVDHNRDFYTDFFGFKTLERSYLLKIGKTVVERPQYMFLRVALAIHRDDWEGIVNTYNLMSMRKATHATPTLYSAGTRAQNYISCFLLTMKEDSLDGIYDTLKRCALISKAAGGIGLNVDVIRCFGSYIASTNGRSNGLAPMLRNFNETARYVDQCFPAKTRIFTDQGFVKMKRIKQGDKVMTHKGRFKKVTKVLQYDAKQIPMIQIKTNKKSLTVTEQHPFLVVSNPLDSINEKTIAAHDTIRHLNLGIARFEWKDAKELNVGDFMVIPDMMNVQDLDLKNEATWNNHFLVRLEEKKSFIPESPMTLYDLEVEDDHSYTTEVSVVHNGGGKRKGSFAIYLQPWHADIEDFLDLKRDDGNPDIKAKDLFYALWVPDLFMNRVIQALNLKEASGGKDPDVMWSLFSNHSCKGLHDTWGAEFEQLYLKYEQEKRYIKQVPILELWYKILDTQFHTGGPYFLFKDQCNRLSNQNHLGTIKSSNLCTEIIQYTSPDECSCCNLASICLPAFVKDGKFDFEDFGRTVEQFTVNLNKIIDINDYPIPEAKKSNFRHRPIGIGVQGLANLFFLLGLAWDSEEAKKLNREISECMYYHFLKKSNELAMKEGPFPSYHENGGCALSHGIFQFELFDKSNKKATEWLEQVESKRRIHMSSHYGTEFSDIDKTSIKVDVNAFPWRKEKIVLSGRYDFEPLRASILKHGVRNSLGIAWMPTASTSQIMGNNEGFEPIESILFKREVLSGEFLVFVPQLAADLEKLGLWNKEMATKIRAHDGSIQGIEEIPEHIRNVYKTAYEIEVSDILDMAEDRNMFIDQSQSFSCFMKTSKEEEEDDTEDEEEEENIDSESEKEEEGSKSLKRKLETKPREVKKPKNKSFAIDTELKIRKRPATLSDLSNYLISGYRRGLKTGMYYLRLRTFQPIKFTLRNTQKVVTKNTVSVFEPSNQTTKPSSSVTSCSLNPLGKPDCESCMG